MENIFIWFKQIFSVQIISVLLGNLVTNEKYLKYINLITSVILISLLINPLLMIMGKNVDVLNVSQEFNKYIESKELKYNENSIYDEFNNSIKKELESDLFNELTEQNITAKKITLNLDTDENSENFGNISRVEVFVENVSDVEKTYSFVSEYLKLDRNNVKVVWKG